jgi:glycosyltransferase involved in cell wall biosynthesis
MRILYASKRGYIPQRVDGALFAAHSLLTLLARRGHQCEAVASIDPRHRGRLAVYRMARALSARRILALRDRQPGYPTRRAWDDLVAPVVRSRFERFRPDLVLTQLEGCQAIAREAIAAGVPVIVWIHDNLFTYFKGEVPRGPLLLTVSATDVVAAGMAARLGYDSPVLYPPVDLDRCRAPRAGADMVTLINPVRQKGVEIVLQVAELLPHRRFLLVETWPLSAEQRTGLAQRLKRLPNVTFRRPSPEIRSVYGRTKVLMAPSQLVEAFCTVAFEAHANGIPVVASRIGGIPNTVGEGGILLPPDAPPDAWADAVEGLFDTAAEYERLSQKALANAARPEFDPERIVDRFLGIAEVHMARARAVGMVTPAGRG